MTRPVSVPPFLFPAIPVQLLVAFFSAQMMLTSTGDEEWEDPSLSLKIYNTRCPSFPSLSKNKPRASVRTSDTKMFYSNLPSH